MWIVGTGLIARSFQPYAGRHDDAVAFASGVSDSTCTDSDSFGRECALLNQVLDRARSEDLRVIYFSGGGAIYGRWKNPVTEFDRLEPKTAYGRHQLACEAAVVASGIRYLVARLPNVVGPTANRRQLIPSLVDQAMSGSVKVQRNAERDLIDVEDVGRVVSELLDAAAEREIVNVASGSSVAASVIVDEICRILKVQPRIVSQAGGEPQKFSTIHLEELLGYDAFSDANCYREILQRYVPRLAEEILGTPAP